MISNGVAELTKIAELYAALAAARAAARAAAPVDDAECTRIADRASAILAEMTTTPATCDADITCKLRAADGEREDSSERATLLESALADARRLAPEVARLLAGPTPAHVTESTLADARRLSRDWSYWRCRPRHMG